MKKLTSFMVALAVLALAGMAQTGNAHAGEEAGLFSISPYVGGIVYDDVQQRQLVQNRPIYGLRLGFDLTDHLGAELVGSYANVMYKKTATGPNDHFSDWHTHLDLLWNFMPLTRFVPYLAIGGGIQKMNYHSGDPLFNRGDETDPTMNVGVGAKMFVTRDMNVRLDARHIFDYRPGKDTIHNWEYSMGLGFLFGDRREAAKSVEAAPAEPAAAPAEAAPPAAAPVPAAEPTAGHYKYCVTLHTEFDIDRAMIRPEYRDEIAKVGDFMKKYPTTTAVIEGHTDNVGTYNHNMELSQRRAEAVVNYLVDNFGIDRSRLTARGYGFTRPVADNGTEEGKQKNRRIEAIIDCAFDVQQLPPPERLCMHLVLDFDSGKANVKSEYKNEIGKVADYMKQYPTTTAVIEGHTDNVGDADANMKLSQQRAEAVVNTLVNDFGIERSRLSAKGYGSTRRISYNNTPEGRAMNRRINAVIDCVVRK